MWLQGSRSGACLQFTSTEEGALNELEGDLASRARVSGGRRRSGRPPPVDRLEFVVFESGRAVVGDRSIEAPDSPGWGAGPDAVEVVGGAPGGRLVPGRIGIRRGAVAG